MMQALLLGLMWWAGLSQAVGAVCQKGEHPHVPKTFRATKNVPTMSRPLMM